MGSQRAGLAGDPVLAPRGTSTLHTGERPARPLVCLLAADLLAVHVADTAQPVELRLEAAGARVRAEVSELRLDGEPAGRLLLATVRDPGSGTREALLTIRTGEVEVRIGPDPLASLGSDLRTLIRERLAPIGPRARAAVLEQLVELAAAGDVTRDPLGLATSMALLREGLRDALPTCVVDREEPHGLHFDSIVALDSRSFYARGWTLDAQAPLRRLTLVSPEGERIELLDRLYRSPRPDVDRFYEHADERSGRDIGFLGYFETAAPSLVGDGWILEMENTLGVGKEVSGPPVARNLLEARGAILSDLQRKDRCDTALMDHVVPAVTRIQERLGEQVDIEHVAQVGASVQDPEISIVVPLYSRIDLVEQQLAQFAGDGEIARSDLIYVLDSPELEDGLLHAAGQLFELYGVSFRVAVLSANGGFSVANNRGASLARGRLLLLLNSDVLPDRPGWLSRMARFYDRRPRIGALGPKLLFEDGSLQHAGIAFERPAGSAAWENAHFFKGLHRSLPAANVARPVPAVTGACMMIDRALYAALGGLRGLYVQGDYEDTDLCLRLREEGRESWYLPDVELYHLEGQSYSSEARRATSRYNIWLHDRLWRSAMERAMAELGVAAGVRS